MTTKPTAETDSPSRGFAWDAERRFAVIFTGFLLLSALAHVSAFFIFQVAYPQRVTIPPPAAQVTILDPAIPAHRPVLAWIAAEDPALSATVSRAKPAGLMTVPYKASFETTRAWPRSAARPVETVALPPGRAGLSLVESAIEQPPAERQELPPSPTSVSVSGPLTAIPLEKPMALPSKTTQSLTPARFLVGVDASGVVRHAMLQSSSGNDTIDTETARNITALKFGKSGNDITWGFVTISWGDDILIRDPEIKVNSSPAQ